MDARTVFSWALVAALAAISWFLVRPVLSWLLAAGLLAFVLFPVHRRLEPRMGARPSAGLLTVLVVVLVVAPVLVGVNAAVERGPALLDGFAAAGGAERLQDVVRRYVGVTLPVQSLLAAAAERLSAYARERASEAIFISLHALVGFLLLTFVLYYLLKDGRRLVAWLRRATPLAPEVREDLVESAHGMTVAVLEGHVLVAAVQGAVAGVSLFLTGVPRPLLLTGAMMVLALVPVVGVAPVLGSAVVYLFLEGRVLSAAFVFVWGLTAVAITDDYLRALLIDRQSEMHPAVIFVGITGGTYLLGAIGLFVGPILLGLARRTVEVLGSHYGVSPDLGR